MYRFLIIAHAGEVKQDEMPDNWMPGMLKMSTEIWLVANNAAEALEEAREVIVATNYFVKRIEKILDPQNPLKAYVPPENVQQIRG